MEFRWLEQFLIIARTGTLSAAAEQLNISQPALSRSMQALERELQVSLFDRKGSRLSLNECGKAACDEFAALLKSRDRMVENLQKLSDSLQNCTIGSSLLTPLLLLEKPLASRCSCRFKLEESEELLEKQFEEGLLQALILSHPLSVPGVCSMPLLEEHLVLLFPQDHPFASSDCVSLEQINGESLLCLGRVGVWKSLINTWFDRSRIYYFDTRDEIAEMTELSSLPVIKSNRSLEREGMIPGRKAVEISGLCTSVQSWLITPVSSPLLKLAAEVQESLSPSSNLPD